jgi:hypothetical protein
MATKTEIIANLKKEYPKLKAGSEEAGYTDLSPADYEATIEQWADNLIAKAAEEAEALAKEQAKADALAKLSALGIDPKALGL